jgi:hypothetical protein
MANPFASFFFPNASNSGGTVNQELRQRIALAMLMKQSKYPKTLGEGLASIGEDVSNAFLTKALEQQDIEAQAQGRKAFPDTAAGALTKSAYADDEPTSPARSIVPAVQPVTPTISQPPLPVSEGGYNILDAQAGMKPGSARGQAAGERAYPGNPDMQAYMSQMAAKEQTRPGDVSQSGARGMFQFVPGTARQYGLTNPDSDSASADAMQKFTADNAAAFTRANGRMPTMAELAVMHQQGGQTGMNMMAGTGNASPRNLALNNVPPEAGPAQAVDKIKGYYGLPETPVDPRAGVAAALQAQQQPRVMAFSGEESPAVPPPPPVPQQPQQTAQVQPAPQPPQVRPVPPPAAAQPGTPGYVTPEQAPLPPKRILPPHPDAIDAQRKILENPGNQYVQQRGQMIIQRLEEQRKQQQGLIDEDYKAKQTQQRELAKLREEQLATQTKRIADEEHVRQQISTGKIIQMEGRAYKVQDDGTLKDITPGQTGEGPPQIKMTQDQSDTLKFYKMGKTAASQLEGKERLLAEGWASELAGKVPFAGNKLMSSQYRAAKNAAGLLVQADLRDTSGATIGTKEFSDRFDLLIPRPGDDALIIRQKAEARRAVLEGQRLALGTARPMADYVDKEHAKEQAEKASTLAREMEGKDKSKTYEKNGIFRRWNGSYWEEH